MQPKKIRGFTTHAPTGAHIPVLFESLDSPKYHEDLQNRHAYTIVMLQDKWSLPKEEVAAILQKYQIPAYVNHPEVNQNNMPTNLIDYALFFAEYIKAVEQKASIVHNKLKAKKLEELIGK